MSPRGDRNRFGIKLKPQVFGSRLGTDKEIHEPLFGLELSLEDVLNNRKVLLHNILLQKNIRWEPMTERLALKLDAKRLWCKQPLILLYLKVASREKEEGF